MINNLLYIFIALLALVWLWVIYNKYKPAKKGNQQPEQKSQEDNSLVVEVLKEDHYSETALHL
jgi:cbb3-type cytochrome oxidase subunit 3